METKKGNAKVKQGSCQNESKEVAYITNSKDVHVNKASYLVET